MLSRDVRSVMVRAPGLERVIPGSAEERQEREVDHHSPLFRVIPIPDDEFTILDHIPQII
jgi:hypothetical protein